MKLVVHVDGGARGNPGPAAIGVVIADEAGTLLERHGERIGRTTNNVAEYRALLTGLAHARALGATEVEVIGDSELVAKQVNGEYKVKHAGLQPLHAQALAALQAFDGWRLRTVPRSQNAAADALVNAALDAAL
jgi:ribonuclease HI